MRPSLPVDTAMQKATFQRRQLKHTMTHLRRGSGMCYCPAQGARCNSEIGSWGKDPARPSLLSFTSALGILQHSPS